MEARPTPSEDAVREQMREEEATLGGASEDDAPPAAEAVDDDRLESGDPDPAEDQPPEPTEDLGDHDPLAAAGRQRDEYLVLAQRTQADFDNFRKRAARDVAASAGRAKAGLARELLPAVDNLERALEAAGEAEEALATGVRFVHDELIAALGRSGIERFDPSGERFDPTSHEAIATRPEEGVEAGLVLDVAQKGYRTPDLVVRPARVVVSA